jgi:hypothetical protein
MTAGAGRRALRRHRRGVLLTSAVITGVGVLTGCSAQVNTAVTVTSATQAQVHVSAQFTHEAATELAPGTAARAQLLALFASRLGVAPTITSSPTALTVAADIDYTHLSAAGDVLGVRSAALSGSGGAVEVDLDLVPASKLASAITGSVATQPDASALSATLLASTELSVSVRFPGGIHSAVSAVGTPARDGDVATVTRPVSSTGSGVFQVTGDPINHHWLAKGGAGIIVAGAAAAAALVLRRRRY